MTPRAKALTASATTASASGGPTVPANDLRVLIGAFKSLGYDSAELLAAINLTEQDLSEPDGRVSCAVYETLLRAALQRRFIPNIALHLGMSVPIGAYPLLDYLILTCDDVGSATRQLARYFQLIESPISYDVQEDDDPIRVVISGSNPFGAEYSATLMVRHLRAEAEGPATAECVSFTHRPDDAAEFSRVLGCRVDAPASWTGVTFDRRSWKRPLRRRDPVLRRVLEGHADEILSRHPTSNGFIADVRRALASQITRGDVRVGSVARRLMTSARTLQRRLADEGVTFQALVEDSRKEAAALYMSDNTMAISEIAYLLGYSEPAPFHRAFKRWYGVTPDVFRKRRVTSNDRITLV
jgi:AraC-like DNA-binding protein